MKLISSGRSRISAPITWYHFQKFLSCIFLLKFMHFLEPGKHNAGDGVLSNN
jgi:hypothetical protein